MLALGHAKTRNAPLRTSVPVTRPIDLCDVQIATRRFCRSMDFDESDVFGAVIGVSELANRMLVETPGNGHVSLRACKVKGVYALEAQVTRAEGSPEEPAESGSVTIRPRRPFQRDH